MSPNKQRYSTTPPSPVIREKRLQKLERLLGEKISPELLVAAAEKAKENADTVGALMPVARGKEREVGVPRKQSWVGEWNRGDMKDVQKGLRALKAR